jgi:hypothetical protein
MKKLIGFLALIFIANTAQVFASGTPCKVGEIGPGGGYIFYCDDLNNPKLSAGKIGLEAAPSDQNINGQRWSNIKSTAGAKGTEVGTGQANTKAIIEQPGHTDSAAKLCVDIKGFNDWFLPSKDELDLMFTNLKAATPSVGGFNFYVYWSSSEDEEGYVWQQGFNAGNQNSGYKNDSLYVRCVRAF